MLDFEREQEPTDEIKLKVIKSYINFFPIDNPKPYWWVEYESWFEALAPMDITLAWNRMNECIQCHSEQLKSRLAQLEELYGAEPDEEQDYDAGDRLAMLPEFFENSFLRISTTKVVNEWMRCKMHRSDYSQALIIRVAVYQMDTGDDVAGTFLDLLSKYVTVTMESQVN